MSTEPWAPEVIARYLTVGGATVDITEKAIERTEGETGYGPIGNGYSGYRQPTELVDITLTALCSGCTATDEHEFTDLYAYARKGFLDELKPWQSPKTWAQSHAEKCRALPRPTA
ncbi:hypothetical protein ADK55_18635 [Streptomyces sp. WM4235]|uniref:hypothetical protein n=1 Tax=Streptomyces sp. WM4235 TaxID=1415551 RepID=UPI0006AE29DE|nr:hypothetical protein [Streptomyces sp. WM4235]KOU50560.1 hypothetical protein ADK55_18635 [Streptomyces sp. WM4235]